MTDLLLARSCDVDAGEPIRAGTGHCETDCGQLQNQDVVCSSLVRTVQHFFVAAVMPPYAAVVGRYRVRTLWVQVLVVLHTHTPI